MKKLILILVAAITFSVFAESRWTGEEVSDTTESTCDLRYIRARDAVQRISNITGLKVVLDAVTIDALSFNTTLNRRRTLAEEARVLVETLYLYGIEFQMESECLVIRTRKPQFIGAARQRNPKFEKELQGRAGRTSGKIDFKNAPMDCVVDVFAEMTDSLVIRNPFVFENITFKCEACTVQDFCNMFYEHGLVIDKIADRIFILREWRVNEFGRTAIEQQCYVQSLAPKSIQKISIADTNERKTERLVIEPQIGWKVEAGNEHEKTGIGVPRNNQQRKISPGIEKIKKVREAKAAPLS